MINFIKNRLKLNKNSATEKQCNENELQMLLDSEGKTIKKACYNFENARLNFSAELKQKILARRENPMEKFKQFWEAFFNVKRLKPALAFVVLVAIIAGTIHFLPLLLPGKDKADSPFNQFSKLVINSAYAMDNFELRPEAMDSAGVSGAAVYILTSKEAVDTKLIKDNIMVEPAIDFEIKQISSTEWKIIPQEPLSPNTVLKVTLNTTYYDESGQLQKRDYNWAYQVKDSFKILTTIPRDMGTDVPTSSGIEITFSHDNFTDYEKYFSLSPTVEGRFEKHGRTLVFVPTKGLKEATIYTVTVKAGLPISDSEQKLTADKVIKFETKGVQEFYRRRGYFNVYQKMLEFSSAEKPIVQVYTNEENQEASVKVYKFNSNKEYLSALDRSNALPWWSYSRDVYVYDTSKLTAFRTLTASIKKGRYIKFIELPESLPAGFYIVDFELAGDKEQIWFQVTDLAAYINVTKTKTIVWVNDLITKKQIVGAQVQIVGQNSKYETDNNGITTFNTPQEITERSNSSYLEITDNGRSLILPASYSSHFSYNSIDEPDNYWRYLYTDRPKYKPTDTIKFWGMVKSRNGQKINEKITLAFIKEGYINYYYQPVSISEQELALNDFGAYSGEIPLTNIRPDYYVLQLKVGDKIISNQYLQVRSYVKPAYQLSLTPDRTAAMAGDNINFDIQASFFEGTPVPHLPLVFKMPEGDYQFTTDENGRAKLTYTKKYFECSYNENCWPVSAWLRIQPQNSELAEITAETSVRFFGGKRYAKTEAGYPGKGKAELKISTYKLDLKKAANSSWRDDLGDEIAPNTRIDGQVIKITHIKTQTGTYYDFISKKSYPTYNYSSREETVDSFTANSGANGVYVYKRDVEAETSYRVNLKIFSEDGRYDVVSAHFYYHNGDGIDYYNSYYNNYYSFKLPDKTYNIGEKVEADMRQNEKSLLDGGDNKYLFLQMQSGLQEYSVSDNSTYSFNFEERDIPNVNLEGIYFNGSAYFIASTEQVKFNTDNRRLDINIKTDKNNYQPGEDVTIFLSVKNKEGKAVKAEVNVNVVDEAYYAVISDTADPMGNIYRSVSTGSYFSEYSHKTLNDAAAAERGGCFLAGTKILMADGSAKAIEEIKIGDKIKTIVEPLHIKYDKGEVVELFKHTVGEYLIINNKLRLTPEHRVYSNYSFVVASELRLGDWLLDQDGNKIFITSIEHKEEIAEVYNFRVEPQHTYIADGFYVHNDKGGVREILVDAPLFASVTTDGNGKGLVTFTLPDNITSWRITAQAISQDLEVGTAVGNINVSLPVFIDATVGSEYLVADKPIARLRAYGTALNVNDEAIFNLEAESLGVKKSDNVITEAFKFAFIELPKLILGKHNITYRVTINKGKDALKLPINVINSRLSKRETKEETLTTDTKINVATDDLIKVVLGDINRLQIYDPLQHLSWSWADRIDQAIARKKSRELINKLFNDDLTIPKISPEMYQQSSGGVALLPYSSEDLTLSARLAGVAADEFDKTSLEQYFLQIFNNKSSNREEISLALYGLASLDAPVLSLLNNWVKRDDLSVKERLYIALAFHKIGATEKARSIYYDIAANYGQQKLPAIKISIDNNEETTGELTALTSVLASAVQVQEKQGYWYYLNHSHSVIDLEGIAYIQEIAPDITNSAIEVIYEANGKKTTINFNDNYTYSFLLEPQQASSVKFHKVEGKVGITIITNKPFNASTEKQDNDINISREFYVDGQKTNTFQEDNTIEIRLYPTISGDALDGRYQITDILPSGLMPITKYYYGGNYGSNCHRWYPYHSEGQKVKYIIWKGWNSNNCSNYISYLARVKTKGEYKVEPTIIQSLENTDYINYDKTNSIININ